MAQRLTDLWHHVLGVDTSPVQIDRARQLVPGARFMHADASALLFDRRPSTRSSASTY